MNVQIGLLGCGTVGSGVVQLLQRRVDKIQAMTGMRPVLKHILVRDPAKPRGVNLDGIHITTCPEDILSDPDVRIVVETIGGIDDAKRMLLAAIAAGKHVVTANKDLIASHGPEIWEAATKAGVDVYYEAAVGGAIPLIRPLKESLSANDITDLKGILNGTTNYILTRMTETRADYADALREAQELGYAEADPSSDVDGLDAARKLAILASIAFHARVRLEDVEVEGIRSVSARDVQYAEELGAVIKLLATGTDRGGHLALRVRPTLVPKEHPLASVSDSYNALFVRGDASGDLMFFGRGAGSLPTASAVVGDLIDVLRNLRLGVVQSAPQYCLPNKRIDANSLEPQRHYLRLLVEDQPGVFARIASVFGDVGVSMESVLQKRVEKRSAEIVIVTHRTMPQRLRKVLDALGTEVSVREVCSVMPVEPSDDEARAEDELGLAGDAEVLPAAEA
ncbi:MAG: homoserine dehydrogenase [Alicyclobacillus herbarius]|uniref:homoserine dehydrogenase n=1 Tax=Alicyclobacillus herbarius TaxID=122960 RepID=UPI002351F925|nr:homoserine dehydrogenase [Alicyclobacillus herbarius]MCL6632250.1 homoserine dehydrogenase [Alicyclobacillus herbarius]